MSDIDSNDDWSSDDASDPARAEGQSPSAGSPAGQTPADQTPADPAPADQTRKAGGFLRELLIVVGIVLALMFVINTFVARQYVVPSESMEPTLHGCFGCSNDRIVVDKLTYRFSDPKPGDVVVFKAPSESWEGSWSSPRSNNPVIHKLQDVLSWFAIAPPDENNLVKRVIATGGQTVECRNESGQGVTVDGRPLNEPYVDRSLQTGETGLEDTGVSCYGEDFGPITVPEGNVWVMGDNRSYSADSRFHTEDEFHGTVPVSDIRGKVRFIVYPFSRFGGVGSVDPQ